MNVFQVFTGHVRSAVEAVGRSGAFKAPPDLSRIVVEPPREASHGDLATNAAMVLAKPAKTNPRALAEALADWIDADGNPTNDPAGFIRDHTGALRTFGAHKGSGLAVMCEIMAAAVAGGQGAWQAAQFIREKTTSRCATEGIKWPATSNFGATGCSRLWHA